MAQNPGSLLMAFLLGKALAEQAGASPAQANQWGAVQMAAGLSGPSILLVYEMARRDIAAQAASSLPATREDAEEIGSLLGEVAESVQVAGEWAKKSEQVAQQAVTKAEEAVQASQKAASSADSADQAAKRAAVSAEAAATAAATTAELVNEMRREISDWKNQAQTACSQETVEQILGIVQQLLRNSGRTPPAMSGGRTVDEV